MRGRAGEEGPAGGGGASRPRQSDDDAPEQRRLGPRGTLNKKTTKKGELGVLVRGLSVSLSVCACVGVKAQTGAGEKGAPAARPTPDAPRQQRPSLSPLLLSLSLLYSSPNPSPLTIASRKRSAIFALLA